MTERTVEQERELIRDARGRGRMGKLGLYARLSGPGWLQGAITLGGGSLAGSLYLGVLGGVSLLWLQPVAMIMGVIMLSAIGYVTLSTGERPMRAITRHVNPVLGWGWAIATLMANLVWALPQFSLGTAAIRQNLLPGIFGPGGMPDWLDKMIVCGVILAISITMVWSYGSGRAGVRLFEVVLKLMVGVIVVSFFGVIVKMSVTGDGLQWGRILAGFVPDFALCASPAETFTPYLEALEPRVRDLWTGIIVGNQRDVMITAAATAVGINMTFLFPYSMLKKGWDGEFRGFAIFDLAIGLFVPFVLATSCVVVASAAQFHTRPAPGLLGETNATGAVIEPAEKMQAGYQALCVWRLRFELAPGEFESLGAGQRNERIAALPLADRRLAAMLVKRDAFDLALSLAPLTGDVVAQRVFGIGVFGMAVSTTIILMLINGFVVCEMLGAPAQGAVFRFGCLMPAVGALGPFFWKQAAPWLAVPTSIFGMTLLPIAYFTFFMMMNHKKLLGPHLPTGAKRVVWNLLMAVAASLAAFGSLWAVWNKARGKGLAVVAGFILLVLVAHFARRRRAR